MAEISAWQGDEFSTETWSLICIKITLFNFRQRRGTASDFTENHLFKSFGNEQFSFQTLYVFNGRRKSFLFPEIKKEPFQTIHKR